MGIIGPRLTRKELEASGQKTMQGDGLKAVLPGVAADAMTMDRKAFDTNRELASKIQKLVAELKPSDAGVPRFVLAWRMYPNADSKYWDTAAKDHICGCGCGCPIGGDGG
jgi:hypothetical protein